MSVKKKRTIGPCRGVTWLYYVVFLWSRDFFPPLYLDPRFRPLLLKLSFEILGQAWRNRLMHRLCHPVQGSDCEWPGTWGSNFLRRGLCKQPQGKNGTT